MSHLRMDLPPITLSTFDSERLERLAVAAADKFPRTADFLAREIGRANVVDSAHLLPGLITMGSKVEYRDDTTGQVRRVTLVFPHEADLNTGKISVLTPIGAALIGLSVSQTIEWQSPAGGWRALTILRVSAPAAAHPAVGAAPVADSPNP
jgi:regulator of nucleoside diphosphate kinase